MTFVAFILTRQGILSKGMRLFHKYPFKSRKTGRSGGNCILPRQAWRYDLAIEKNFQRTYGKRLGWNILCLEDRILLGSLGQRHRHLDDKKVAQLSRILHEKFIEAASTSEELNLGDIEITKVKVNTSFTEVKIWWLCKGEGDEEIEERLKNQRHVLRRVLSESLGINCPELQFFGDRSRVIMQEMDNLFRIADYGMDYRALSNTGRVLGSLQDKDLKAVDIPSEIEVRPSTKE